MTADEIIAALGLEPHPEGGWYVQTFVDGAGVDGRARSTAIYFLLKAEERSHWHRVDAAEIWHWHAGSPIALQIAGSDGQTATHVLGSDLSAGQRPQVVVPAHAWQSARSMGEWRLASASTVLSWRRPAGSPIARAPPLGLHQNGRSIFCIVTFSNRKCGVHFC
jgi:uncharacterized protein